MSDASSLLSGGSTDDSQSDMEATKIDDLHHALCVLVDVAGSLRYRMSESDSYDESDVDRQAEYVTFLRDVISGPRDFDDPEGTGHHAVHNTREYRNEYGNSAPTLETEAHKQPVALYDDDTLSEISGDDIPEQDHINIPVAHSHDKSLYYLVPEDRLDEAKELVRDVTERVIPSSTNWFRYMEGNEDALEDVSDSDDSDNTGDDGGTTGGNDGGNDFEEPFQQLVSDVDGMGPETVRNFRRYVAANDWEVPDEIDMDLDVTDKYDSLDEVPPETVAELSPEQIAELQA